MSDVLVVDDELPIHDMIDLVLGRAHIPYRLAINGRQALTLAQESWPAVVLLDVGLPAPLTGWETWRRLRRRAAGRPLRVVLFTASDLSGAEQRNFEAWGGRKLLKKLAERGELVAVLRSLLAEVEHA
jgi:CheY-like chemotaxis protein